MKMKDTRTILKFFLEYLKEEHTDRYGHLEISSDEEDDGLDPTISRVVDDFIRTELIKNSDDTFGLR